ncbi:hypothetical protein DMH04_52690 [Kibdelosporangium aridum]|uniref:Uncharacterized protein n=1 Tax=Kibdelosporangium aridum TaxID=2030 RepID=A0A428Y3P0_KIBAR|nr:hypothetical protein [Kibdelosporangium aridum]RSM62186.1 hypothetical protein DMH04_52690 [Kibdelosporangium aridum]
MLIPFITGLFALAGVSLGVFLEPVKAKVAARTRLREDRALRCAELVDAAAESREAVKWLLRTIREDQAPMPATAEMITEAEQKYWSARKDLKKALLLIRLTGPDELVTSAEAVSDADRALRKLWFGLQPDARRSHAPEIREALQGSSRALKEFTSSARRLTTSTR